MRRLLVALAALALSGCVQPLSVVPLDNVTEAAGPGGAAGGAVGDAAGDAAAGAGAAVEPPPVPPPTPGNLRPDGTAVPPGRVELAWAPVRAPDGSPVTYDARVRVNGAVERIACLGYAEPRCALDVPPGASVTWTVVARAAGQRSPPAEAAFETHAPPPAPVRLAPDGDRVRSGTLDLTWEPGPTPDRAGATGTRAGASSSGARVTYTVTATVNGREQTLCSGATRTTCQLRASPGDTIIWTVTAHAHGLASPPATAGFTVNTPPRVDDLEAPFRNGQEQVPMRDLNIAWDAEDTDRDPVRVEVTLTSAGDEDEICQGADAEDECDLPRLRAGTTYTLTVTPFDDLDAGEPKSLTFTTRLPIVFIHGYDGDAQTWAKAATWFTSRGYDVLDFHSVTGTRTLVYATGDGAGGIEDAAHEVVFAIQEALEDNGYDGNSQRFDVVAHSMGGLVTRTLIERAGQSIRGTIIDEDMGLLMRRVVFAATPHRGSDDADFCEPPEWWMYNRQQDQMCLDLRPGSEFLRALGISSSNRYLTLRGKQDWMVTEESAQLPNVRHEELERVCHTVKWHTDVVCDSGITESPLAFGHIVSFLG